MDLSLPNFVQCLIRKFVDFLLEFDCVITYICFLTPKGCSLSVLSNVESGRKFVYFLLESSILVPTSKWCRNGRGFSLSVSSTISLSLKRWMMKSKCTALEYPMPSAYGVWLLASSRDNVVATSLFHCQYSFAPPHRRTQNSCIESFNVFVRIFQ